MAVRSVFQSPSVNWNRQRLLIHLLLLCVFLNLMECMHALNSMQPLNGLRIDLVHINSLLPPNITSTERWKRAVQHSQARLEKLQIMSSHTDKLHGDDQPSDIDTPVSIGRGDYLMQMAIGSPALSFSAMLDTGSDLIWTQCKPCTNCFQQPTPIYDPSQSSTYSTVSCKSSKCNPPIFSCSNNGDCNYHYTYGDQSFSEGILSYETFTFSYQSFSHIAFGCGHNNSGVSVQGAGTVGFGRGGLSLIGQLGPSVGNKFSYCFVSLKDSASKTSPLFLGDTATINGQAVSSTPFIQNSAYPSLYYLELEAIGIGRNFLQIPAGTFDLQSDGSGGFIIDSGTTITYLPQSTYDGVKDALKSSINLPEADGSRVGLDLCFNLQDSSNSSYPAMAFHFKGGAVYNLPAENYLAAVSADMICLAMLPVTGIAPLSVFGNVQQQNYQILYDNENNVLSFAPTTCDTL